MNRMNREIDEALLCEIGPAPSPIPAAGAPKDVYLGGIIHMYVKMKCLHRVVGKAM